MSDGGEEVRVQPVGVFEQHLTNEEHEVRVPMLLLRDEVGREIPIPIGSCDGIAIHIALTGTAVARPLTHDLGLHLIERLSGKLEHIVIDKYTEDGCRATLSITTPTGTQMLQARAGDGIALALRADLPIFITEDVIDQANQAGENTESTGF